MMMTLLIAALFLAFLGSVAAAISKDAEKFLWGSLFLTLGLGIAIVLAGAGYFGAMIILAFLASDLVIFLFFNSVELDDESQRKSLKWERLFTIFLVWVISYITLLGFIKIFAVDEKIALSPSGDNFKGIQQLQELIWEPSWLIILIAMLSMIVLAVGGFMLARKEK